MSNRRLILITGLSGSGKSCAAHALEDQGLFVVDNLPLVMLPQFLSLAQQGTRKHSGVVAVIDVRNRDFLADCEQTLEQVRQQGYDLEVFFFDATDATLLRRYSETRRRHPLAQQEGIAEAIQRERMLLSDLRARATVIIDSSTLTPHQLRHKVVEVVQGEGGALPLNVRVQSFGFRHGVPANSDLVFDVRFLPNPHFIPELQPKTGKDAEVRDYVCGQPVCREFLDHLEGLLLFLLPQYRQEGKSYLTISVGCTGGHHRSVAIAEKLSTALRLEGVTLEVGHRDIDKR